ncbi:glutamyl-tRNA reductase [Pokkaliibacter sp. CJK22405]|uniref:glutamyl-tRNA reductase n=1 Tax=Pokkaliibacter sp. CJK22405 TaxID=3384615 RepID=UPI0039847B44
MQQSMALLALGINHKTAPVEVRERLAFAPEQLGQALQDARMRGALSEVAILSTCNRTELYGVAPLHEGRAVLEWLANFHGVDINELSKSAYVHWDREAIRHMARVACGLDSLILGEPQILGQLKTAFSSAQHNGSLGSRMNRWFQHTFNVAKQVRTQTAIGENPVSVAYAAVSLAQRIFAELSESRALLIGAGETIALVGRHLREAGIKDVTVVNRTLSRAQTLAEELEGRAIPLADLAEYLHEADIVIASTASPLPLIGKGVVERALKKRRYKPMFMVDIAVPRDIEPEVERLEDVYLYTVDDLQQVIEEGVKARQDAAEEAELLIAQGLEHFMEQLRARDAVQTLREMRFNAEQIRDQEVQKALRYLERGQSPEEVLTQLARGLTNKLIHTPSIELKKASAEGRTDMLVQARRLYGLDKAPSED